MQHPGVFEAFFQSQYRLPLHCLHAVLGQLQEQARQLLLLGRIHFRQRFHHPHNGLHADRGVIALHQALKMTGPVGQWGLAVDLLMELNNMRFGAAQIGL
ncbi:hypothetical protein HRbin36_01134 [bacterium HR36]|nr:hypothetical protein HRbin36_01134 [bacterium HR36]